jgi:PAS domain S-box-containing protein
VDKLKLNIDSPLLQKYQTALYQSAIGIWEWSRKTNIIHCDRGVCRLYGVDADQMEGDPETWYSFILPEDRELTRHMIDQVWKDKMEIDSKFRIKLQSGEIKHIRTSAVKIFDERKQVAHLVGLNWDVTKESTLKKDLAETKKFLEVIIDSVPDPIFVKNRQHQWIFGNAEFANILGVTKQHFLGKSDSDFFDDSLRNTYWENDEKVFSTGLSMENEEKIRDGNGQYRDILTKKTLMPAEGKDSDDLMLVGVIRDITEIKKIQKSLIDQSKLASLGEVSAGMAHEINNPLSIISGKMMILKNQLEREAPLDKIRLTNTCDAVLKNCLRIEKIVRALNSFSRNSENDPLETVRLSEIFSELREFISEKLEKADIQLNINLENNDLMVRARAPELMQVFINLINNSFDAIRNLDDRWIKIDVKSQEKIVEIEVVDSGAGIQPEVAKSMMDFFFTTKPSGQGTGLGLSLARQIIKSHNGSIEYSPDSKNTTFRIELPD